jgi:hypothetical protein
MAMRLLRVSLARIRVLPVALLATVLSVGFLAAPPCTVACSCMPPEPLAAYARDDGAAIFVGRAGAQVGDAVAFEIERWYWGAGAAPVVAVVPGDGAMCGLSVKPGDHMLLVASRGEDGRFTPSNCLPFGVIGTPEGTRLLAEANATFGGGTPPGPTVVPTEPPLAEPAPMPAGGPANLLPVLLMGGAILGFGALVAGLVVAARRRPSAG